MQAAIWSRGQGTSLKPQEIPQYILPTDKKSSSEAFLERLKCLHDSVPEVRLRKMNTQRSSALFEDSIGTSVGKRRRPRGAIVRGSAGIWQHGGLESSPMLAPIQQASFPRALEVSLSRALNGFTKLITSFSAFLKEPKATQVQTSRGSPLSR
ncbi:uncharacterized protein V5649_009743 [Rhynchonycteris naso]